jgi:membrane-bound lytic murein transglycosylase D
MLRRSFVALFLLAAVVVGAAAPAQAHVLLVAASSQHVDAQIRRLRGTPSASADVVKAVVRLREQAPTLIAAAEKYDVPLELLAIPFVETRYRNLEERENHLRCCAGLWQLDRRTARSLGLVVHGGIDERLDVVKATDAALRHLSELREEFGSWSSAVVAYNIGKTRLRHVMRDSHVDDAWELTRRGLIGPFLTKVASASVVLGGELEAAQRQHAFVMASVEAPR